MGYFSLQVITNQGLQAMARAEAGESSLMFTVMKTGDGVYSSEEKEGLDSVIDLKGAKQSFPISGITTKDKTIELKAVISNENLEEGYQIREAGVFARENDKDEILVAISLCTKDPTLVPKFEDIPIEMIISDFLAYSGTGDFTINYTSGAYVPLEVFLEKFGLLKEVAFSGKASDLVNDIKFLTSIPTASGNVLGGVKIGSNITNNAGVISLAKANVTSALGFTPPAYEEGTFTPVTTSSSWTVHSSYGRYVKIGKLVFIYGYYKITTSSASTDANIPTLPFTPVTNNNNVDNNGGCVGNWISTVELADASNEESCLGGNLYTYNVNKNIYARSQNSSRKRMPSNTQLTFSFSAIYRTAS